MNSLNLDERNRADYSVNHKLKMSRNHQNNSGRKSEWKLRNDAYLEDVKQNPEYQLLTDGLYYKELKKGAGEESPKMFSVVTCHYKGTLINGKEFDNSWKRGCPEAFRCRDLIAGFTSALVRMHIGDHWQVVIPASLGYGAKSSGPIPGGSTLIFEIELLGIA